MPIYKERDDKLSFQVPDTGEIKIKIDCYDGTIVRGSFHFNDFKHVNCGQTVVIGSAQGLKGKAIKVKGAAQNPDRNPVKIQHTIFDDQGNSVSYTFPDNYSGTPEYTSPPANVDYEFKINMR